MRGLQPSKMDSLMLMKWWWSVFLCVCERDIGEVAAGCHSGQQDGYSVRVGTGE